MTDWERDGYVVLKGAVPWALCDEVREDYCRDKRDGRSKNQSEYHYGGPPRDFGLWRRSEACRRVAWATARGAEPFQTLNFERGSSQPLHQDHAHFETEPPGKMFAVWVALEDVREESGPLVVYPGSHRHHAVEFGELGLEPAEYGTKDPNYLKYEAHIADLALSWKPEPMLLRKGDAVVFGGRLIHGGSRILDPTKTRYSQVTHYWEPEGTEECYAPMLSSPGRRAVKDMASKAFGDPRNWEAH